VGSREKGDRGDARQMKYACFDTYLPREVDGQWLSTFTSTGHYLALQRVELAIHFLRLSEWFWGIEIEDTDPECAFSCAWRFAFCGLVVNFILLKNVGGRCD